MCLSASDCGQLCPYCHFQASLRDLLVPLRPGPVHSSKLALACPASQSLLTGSNLHPVLLIGSPLPPVVLDWSTRQLTDPLQSEKMVSVASSSATMDLTAVLPALVEGIAQEVGVDLGELKVILVGDETQLDAKPFQTLREQYHLISRLTSFVIQSLMLRSA